MQRLGLFSDLGRPPRILALGAHSDDIEIGCGGTLLRLQAERRDLDVTWVVFCSTPARAREAEASAQSFLEGAAQRRVLVKSHRDGFLPAEWSQVKEEFEELKALVSPDLILTHQGKDAHQDHRVVSELAWNTWRDHLILEFEIPKYDGDFGNPSVYVPLDARTVERKIELLLRAFPTQAGKSWFTADLFRSVARIRGMECAAPERHAEAFYARKLCL